MKSSIFAPLARHIGVRKYALNTLSLYAEHFVRLGVGLLVSLWVVRYLGPERFGLLSYAQAYAAILISFASLGLDAVVVRELYNKRSREETVLGTVFLLKLAASCIAFLLIVSSALLIEGSGVQFRLIAIAGGTVLFTSTSTIEYYFQSEVKGHRIAIAKSCALISTAIVRIILIQLDADLIYFALALLFDAAAIAMFLIYFYNRAGHNLRNWRWDGKMAVDFLKSALFLSLNSAMVLLFWNVDKLMLRYLMNDFALIGIYSAAVKLYEIWGFVPVVLCAAVFPAILSARDTPSLYKARLQLLADALFWGGAALSVVGISLAKPIISLALGDEFLPATEVFRIAMLSNVFVFLGVLGSRYLIIESLEFLLFFRTLLGLICNIALNYLLIMRYGLEGAAISTVISTAVVTIGADLIAFRRLKGILLIKIKSPLSILRIPYRLIRNNWPL